MTFETSGVQAEELFDCASEETQTARHGLGSDSGPADLPTNTFDSISEDLHLSSANPQQVDEKQEVIGDQETNYVILFKRT